MSTTRCQILRKLWARWTLQRRLAFMILVQQGTKGDVFVVTFDRNGPFRYQVRVPGELIAWKQALGIPQPIPVADATIYGPIVGQPATV